MAKADLDTHFRRIEDMAAEINKFVPDGTVGATDFRADLAGLLVVAIAASYEACVKEVLVSYASTKHADFETFASNNFEKLSSKVSVNDLKRYAKLFDIRIHDRFVSLLKARRTALSARLGNSIENRYEQIMNWRHDFAHAGVKNTTITEALDFHLYAKRVLYCFDKAFQSSN